MIKNDRKWWINEYIDALESSIHIRTGEFVDLRSKNVMLGNSLNETINDQGRGLHTPTPSVVTKEKQNSNNVSAIDFRERVNLYESKKEECE